MSPVFMSRFSSYTCDIFTDLQYIIAFFHLLANITKNKHNEINVWTYFCQCCL